MWDPTSSLHYHCLNSLRNFMRCLLFPFICLRLLGLSTTMYIGAKIVACIGFLTFPMFFALGKDSPGQFWKVLEHFWIYVHGSGDHVDLGGRHDLMVVADTGTVVKTVCTYCLISTLFLQYAQANLTGSLLCYGDIYKWHSNGYKSGQPLASKCGYGRDL